MVKPVPGKCKNAPGKTATCGHCKVFLDSNGEKVCGWDSHRGHHRQNARCFDNCIPDEPGEPDDPSVVDDGGPTIVDDLVKPVPGKCKNAPGKTATCGHCKVFLDSNGEKVCGWDSHRGHHRQNARCFDNCIPDEPGEPDDPSVVDDGGPTIVDDLVKPVPGKCKNAPGKTATCGHCKVFLDSNGEKVCGWDSHHGHHRQNARCFDNCIPDEPGEPDVPGKTSDNLDSVVRDNNDIGLKDCQGRKKATFSTNPGVWCRCNKDGKLLKAKEDCENVGGGRKDRCLWDDSNLVCGVDPDAGDTTAHIS